jgi:hypothetical protein
VSERSDAHGDDDVLSEDESEGLAHISPESRALAEVCQMLMRGDDRDPPEPFQPVALDQLTAFSQLEESQHEDGACDVRYELDGRAMGIGPSTGPDPLFDLFATPISQEKSKKT